MKHTAELTVRSYECDSYNHVNNSVYLNYLEFGRMEFLHAINFDYKGIVAAGYYLYVTHIDIYYKGSAFLDDVLEVSTESSKLGKVSGEFKQVIKKKDPIKGHIEIIIRVKSLFVYSRTVYFYCIYFSQYPRALLQ